MEPLYRNLSLADTIPKNGFIHGHGLIEKPLYNRQKKRKPFYIGHYFVEPIAVFIEIQLCVADS